SCQADLVKDNGHKYFLSVLADSYMPAEYRTMAVFILAVIVNSYNTGQVRTGLNLRVWLQAARRKHREGRTWQIINSLLSPGNEI
ncbi:hypothetical protein ILYODFUR_036930, partial [Ilyodon furcidens]